MTEPHPTYYTIDTKDILQRMEYRNNRIGTHFDGCWKYHPDCLVARLCNEIDHLRQERTALLLQRDEMLTKVHELETKLKEMTG